MNLRFRGGRKKLEYIARRLAAKGYDCYLSFTFLEVKDLDYQSAGLIARTYHLKLELPPEERFKKSDLR